MLCIEKEDSRGKPEAVANSIDASEEESDSANTGACGKVKRQHMDHLAEKGNVGSFHCGLASFYSRSFEDEAKAAVDE